MGNKICVDKKPSKIENIISFNSNQIDQNIINNLNNNVDKEGSQSNSYQHLSMWCLSETNDNGINNVNNINFNNNKQESTNEKQGKENNNFNNSKNNIEIINLNIYVKKNQKFQFVQLKLRIYIKIIFY